MIILFLSLISLCNADYITTNVSTYQISSKSCPVGELCTFSYAYSGGALSLLDSLNNTNSTNSTNQTEILDELTDIYTKLSTVYTIDIANAASPVLKSSFTLLAMLLALTTKRYKTIFVMVLIFYLVTATKRQDDGGGDDDGGGGDGDDDGDDGGGEDDDGYTNSGDTSYYNGNAISSSWYYNGDNYYITAFIFYGYPQENVKIQESCLIQEASNYVMAQAITCLSLLDQFRNCVKIYSDNCTEIITQLTATTENIHNMCVSAANPMTSNIILLLGMNLIMLMIV